MTTRTTSIRADFKAALISALQAKNALSGVQVSYDWPGDVLNQDAVFTAGCTGTVSMNFLQGGRKQRDDLFDLDVVIMSGTHGLSPADSEAKVTGYLSALEDVVADDPGLSALVGLIAIGDLTVDGPHTTRTPEGAMSYFKVTVSIHARYV